MRRALVNQQNMKQQITKHICQQTSIVAVAPHWLHGPLAVLLQASQEASLRASAVTVRDLLKKGVRQQPDIVLVYTDSRDDEASDQVRHLKTTWPLARCIALVEHARQRNPILQAGADDVLLQGASAKQLLEIIR
jgi:DNA-binding NarL/FixJ family response regulator